MPKKLESWEIESLYHRADLNHDGKLVNDELILFLRNEGLNVNIEQARDIFRKYDTNGDGYISLTEFFKMYHALFPYK